MPLKSRRPYILPLELGGGFVISSEKKAWPARILPCNGDEYEEFIPDTHGSILEKPRHH